MDYKFKAPREKEITLKDLEPGEFFIFKDDYNDECYVVNLVCEVGIGIETSYSDDDRLVLDLEDGLARFKRGYTPVVRVEPCEIITFRKVEYRVDKMSTL